MSSLLQFQGVTGKRGVRLELRRVLPLDRWPDSPILGLETELVVCSRCGRAHSRIYHVWRKPVGMLGCWVVFRLNGEKIAPDLSLPIPVFRLPRDARPVSDKENAELWHR